jgi:hypothetical protein
MTPKKEGASTSTQGGHAGDQNSTIKLLGKMGTIRITDMSVLVLNLAVV